MRYWLTGAAMAIAAPVVAQAPAEETAVVAAMADSAAGWNAGDIDRFMAVYSDTPETSFVTSQGLVRGKAAMKARYKARYDFGDAARRGTLSFETLDFRLLDPVPCALHRPLHADLCQREEAERPHQPGLREGSDGLAHHCRP